MAILEALKKWKHYFASSSIIIRTDQLSLKYIHDQRLVEGVQHKLLVKLLGYNYTVEYKKGNENKVADALSRAPHYELLALTCVIPAWIKQVSESYNQDKKCQDLITKLTIDSNSAPQCLDLRFKGKVYIGNTGNLKQQLLATFHNSALGGHS